MILRSLSNLLRPLSLAVLSLALASCVIVPVSSHQSSSLPQAPAAQEEAALPVRVAFIVHVPGTHEQQFGENRTYMASAPRDGMAWGSALANVAKPEEILIAGPGGPPNLTPEFAEFCRTHPVVDITFEWDPEDRLTRVGRTLGVLTASLVDGITLGLVPLPAPYAYRAQFRLTLPGQAADTSPVDLNYTFSRRQTLAPLYLIPQGDEYSVLLVPLCNGCGAELLEQVDRTDWRVEEKRRLLAQFLRDVRPRLEQYAHQARQQGSAIGKP